jgi:hypothetical protein
MAEQLMFALMGKRILLVQAIITKPKIIKYDQNASHR